MQDRADPHPREQALRIAQENPPFDVSPEQAIAAVRDLLGSIGHTCPECPPPGTRRDQQTTNLLRWKSSSLEKTRVGADT
jgi:hypothetical protein